MGNKLHPVLKQAIIENQDLQLEHIDLVDATQELRNNQHDWQRRLYDKLKTIFPNHGEPELTAFYNFYYQALINFSYQSEEENTPAQDKDRKIKSTISWYRARQKATESPGAYSGK